MQPTGLPPVQVSQDSWEYQTIPGWKLQGYPNIKYPRIPGNTRQSWDYPGMQATGLPPVQVFQDSWEYQTIPGLSRDASHRATPSPSILGFLGIPDNPGIIPGCKPQGYPESKYPRIPGNTRQSRIIPGCEPQGYPQSEYPRIPGNARQSQGCKPQGYPQSKYPRIPGNTKQSWDYPGMQATRATPSPSIPGFLGIPDNPGIIPGCKPPPPAPSICLSVCVCLSAVFFRCLGIILGYSIVI